MSKRTHDGFIANEVGDLLGCDDPKAEISKLTNSIMAGKPKGFKIGGEEFQKFSYLLKEAYAILYIVAFSDDKHTIWCVFSTSAKVDEFNTTIHTMKTVLAKKVYAISGWKEMHDLLRLTGCGMPAHIDDINCYVYQLMRVFGVDFEFTGVAEGFLAEIADTKTSKLTHIERKYVEKIKLAYNKRHEDPK